MEVVKDTPVEQAPETFASKWLKTCTDAKGKMNEKDFKGLENMLMKYHETILTVICERQRQIIASEFILDERPRFDKKEVTAKVLKCGDVPYKP